jgi:AmmeMemoRadiSam system protein A
MEPTSLPDSLEVKALGAAERTLLLRVASDSIAHGLAQHEPLPVDPDAYPPALRVPIATFCTLHIGGDLRGCIGTLEAHRSLLQDVKANAHAAAFRDPRFAPLTAAELDETAVEISLLSAMQPLQFSGERDALTQLKPGVHGVVFEYGRHRSTFLPQVWEQLPNVVEFMAHLKYKAGLPPDFWAEEVRLSWYTVSKWKESDLLKETTAAST